jgi:hypothetical protein
MSLNIEKIEHLERQLGGKSHSRKWMKNQRNRKIRRTNKLEKPPINKMYHGWEY